MNAEGPIDKPRLPSPPESPPDYSAVNEPLTDSVGAAGADQHTTYPPARHSARVAENTLLDWHETTNLNEALTKPSDAPNLDQLVTAAGLQSVVGVSRVWDYRDKMAGETTWKDATATRIHSTPEEGPIENPVGLEGRWGSFGPEDTRAQSIKIEQDLLIVQYYDSSKELGVGAGDRSLKYWEPIGVDQLSTMTDPGRVKAVRERAALLESWGDRDMVQVAMIPAGTEICVISGPAAPQVESEYPKSPERPTGGPTAAAMIDRTDFWDAAAPPPDGSVLPDVLKQDRILQAIADVRLGGGPQLLFAEFDEAWIIGRGPVAN